MMYMTDAFGSQTSRSENGRPRSSQVQCVEEAIVTLLADRANSSRIDLLVVLDVLQEPAHTANVLIVDIWVRHGSVAHDVVNDLLASKSVQV